MMSASPAIPVWPGLPGLSGLFPDCVAQGRGSYLIPYDFCVHRRNCEQYAINSKVGNTIAGSLAGTTVSNSATEWNESSFSQCLSSGFY